MKITSKLLIALWTPATVLLVVVYFLAARYEKAEAFFLVLNIVNAPFFIATVVFRKKLDNAFEGIAAAFDSIVVKSQSMRIRLTYARETEVGLFFVAMTALAGLYVGALSLISTDAYLTLIDEDGLVEYSSALFWILAAIFLAVSIIRSDRQSHTYRLQNLPYVLILLFFIVSAGEEISWGQRIFDIEVPDAIRAVNVQDELNLHNMGSISVFSNAFFLIAVTFFLIVPLVRSKRPALRDFMDYFGLPAPNRFAVGTFVITLCVWTFVGIRYGTLGFHPYSFYAENFYTQMDDEIFECMTAWSFLSFSVLNSLKKTSIENT